MALKVNHVLMLHIGTLFAAFLLHCLLLASKAGEYNTPGGKPAGLSDLFHLSVATGTTVGYGDVNPLNLPARAVCWLQMIVSVYVVMLLA